jgi:phosphatidylserine decarboxylase
VKLDPDGTPFIAGAFAPAVIALACRKRAIAAPLAVLPVAIAAFFRDPDRTPDRTDGTDDRLVLAPADGKILHVGAPEPGMAPPGKWQQISIFLSVADVHINRAPYGGTVTEVTYRPGRYRTAFSPASGTENERSEITVVSTVDGEERTVIFRQVVGILARRVVTRVVPGDEISTGERIGLMKFGSRMDVFVPPSVELMVTKGEVTVAGETVLARWPARVELLHS